MKSAQMNGFTLIEIMVTVAILAVIAAIAVPAYTGYISTARNVEGLDNLSAIQIAEEEYAAGNNSAYFSAAPLVTTAALEAASGNLWVAAPATEAARNFTYTVTLVGTTGYTATATGKGGKVPTSVVLTITK